MRKMLPKLVACHCLLFISLSLFSQILPFDNCPGVSVAITRPGFNATLGPHQIYLIDAQGQIQPSGDPINLQINGFGLNTVDGFLYGMYQAYNVINPFLTRVGKNGNYETVGTLKGPDAGPLKASIVNTAAGTMDDQDNYYFTAVVIDLQNILAAPELYVGKVQQVSKLVKSEGVLPVTFTKIDPGTCMNELLAALTNPLEGALQDIAWNPVNGNIYTYIPAPGTNPTPGKMAWFNPNAANPAFTCIDPPQPNIPTNDLSGLYFGTDTMLYILTIDGKYYKGNVQTGTISLVTQTTLPLLNGNLRGDMASCAGKKATALVPFTGCPGVSVAITRPGINSTVAPYHIYTITNAGAIQATGNPITQQMNAFGLNSKDGFLYGMHESINFLNPWLSRVDKNGTVVDLGRLSPPAGSGLSLGIVNTAAATIDNKDNYYFTAVVIDTSIFTSFLPKLYLGKVENVSQLKAGDNITINYTQVLIGTCAPEILKVIMTPEKGLLQDLSYNPIDNRIYTVIPTDGVSPIPAKIAWLNPGAAVPVLNCITPAQPNIAINDLSGLYSDNSGALYILTTDGKFYKGNAGTGVISLVNQTTLPLQGNNLRGDMASCISATPAASQNVPADVIRIVPNPVNGSQTVLSVQCNDNGRAQVQIMDARGNYVRSMIVNLVSGLNKITLDVSRLQRGLYSAILVYPSGHRAVVKFLKL